MPGLAAAQQESEEGSKPEHSAVAVPHKMQPQAASADEAPQAYGSAPTPVPAAEHIPISASAPAELEQGPTTAASDQQGPASCSEPTSADLTSQSRPAEVPPTDQPRYPLNPAERKVAAALLVMLMRASKKGTDSLNAMKYTLVSNSPPISLFMELLPDEGRLPSLKQLEASVSPELRDWLGFISALCAAAESQPLELFARSAECSTHLAAIHNFECTKSAVRQKRLQAIKTFLANSNPAQSGQSSHEPFNMLHERCAALAKHGVSGKMLLVMTTILNEILLLLDADKRQLAAGPLMAGSRSSFTICVDHMLPGELSVCMHGTMVHSDLRSLCGSAQA